MGGERQNTKVDDEQDEYEEWVGRTSIWMRKTWKNRWKNTKAPCVPGR